MRVSSANCAILFCLGLLTACATAVYHPQKSESEMQADVNLCTSAANKKYWMDPIAALLNAYDCLEAKGYSRKNEEFARRVERSAGETRNGNSGPVLPCRVPCKARD
jgi:hypothetical protein